MSPPQNLFQSLPRSVPSADSPQPRTPLSTASPPNHPSPSSRPQTRSQSASSPITTRSNRSPRIHPIISLPCRHPRHAPPIYAAATMQPPIDHDDDSDASGSLSQTSRSSSQGPNSHESMSTSSPNLSDDRLDASPPATDPNPFSFLRHLSNTIQELSNISRNLETELDSCEEKYLQNRDDLSTANNLSTSTSRRLHAMRAELQESRARTKDLEDRVKHLDDESNYLKDVQKKSENELRRLQAEVCALSILVDDAKAQFAESNKNITELTAELTKEKDVVIEEKKNFALMEKTMEGRLSETKDERFKLQAKMEERMLLMSKLQMTLNNSVKEKQTLEKQVSVLKGTVAGTEKDKSTLEQGLVKLKAEYESLDKKMKTWQGERILEEKQKHVVFDELRTMLRLLVTTHHDMANKSAGALAIATGFGREVEQSGLVGHGMSVTALNSIAKVEFMLDDENLFSAAAARKSMFSASVWVKELAMVVLAQRSGVRMMLSEGQKVIALSRRKREDIGEELRNTNLEMAKIKELVMSAKLMKDEGVNKWSRTERAHCEKLNGLVGQVKTMKTRAKKAEESLGDCQEMLMGVQKEHQRCEVHRDEVVGEIEQRDETIVKLKVEHSNQMKSLETKHEEVLAQVARVCEKLNLDKKELTKGLEQEKQMTREAAQKMDTERKSHEEVQRKEKAVRDGIELEKRTLKREVAQECRQAEQARIELKMREAELKRAQESADDAVEFAHKQKLEAMEKMKENEDALRKSLDDSARIENMWKKAVADRDAAIRESKKRASDIEGLIEERDSAQKELEEVRVALRAAERGTSDWRGGTDNNLHDIVKEALKNVQEVNSTDGGAEEHVTVNAGKDKDDEEGSQQIGKGRSDLCIAQLPSSTKKRRIRSGTWRGGLNREVEALSSARTAGIRRADMKKKAKKSSKVQGKGGKESEDIEQDRQDDFIMKDQDLS